MKHLAVTLVLAALATSSAARPAAGQEACTPAWIPTFGGTPGTNGRVRALATFDAGDGPRLYAGGGFTVACGTPASRIAAWDGEAWTALGAGVSGPSTPAVEVRALCTFDDGGGPALYVGGVFATAGGQPAGGIARWDGTSWSTLGTGTNGAVHALAVFDAGSGPALYAGGAFGTAGGVATANVARWNGTAWSAVGAGGTNGPVNALLVFDDGFGGGPELYAGGGFTTAGGGAAAHVARWNGLGWAKLGNGTSDAVWSLAEHDDGGGPALYVGGEFANASGVLSSGIARWDGAGWSGLAGGTNLAVYALAVHDDGSGPRLHVGGRFSAAGGLPLQALARWDGAAWTGLAFEPAASSVWPEVHALATVDVGDGARLLAGGEFADTGGSDSANLSRWDGASWTPLGDGLEDSVWAVAADPTRGLVYAGGIFDSAGSVALGRVASWDGDAWSPLGTGFPTGLVQALIVCDSGVGPALHAAPFGFGLDGVSRWDGSAWTELGPELDGRVHALAFLDDGSGAALYAAGGTSIGGSPARVVRWDGAGWSPLGAGPDGPVNALCVFDDGGGLRIHAGGAFGSAGGVPAAGIACWNGTSWSALGSGIPGGVQSLAVFDDGGGPALFAGGSFDQAGGVPASGLARWDGSSWSAVALLLPPAFPANQPPSVRAMAVFDDGAGPALFIGGSFARVAGVHVRSLARWDGTSWSPLGGGVDGSVIDLQALDDGRGEALYAGGFFQSAVDSHDSHLARWGCPTPPAPSFCDGSDGSLAACPCGNAGSPDAGCDVPHATGGVRLDLVAQTSSPNAATLRGSGFPSASSPAAIVMRSPALDPARPVVFGDGLRCVSTTSLVRLAATQAAGGASTHAFGHLVAAGTFHYQLWFRSNPSTYCDAGAAFNLSSGRSLTW